MLAHPTSRRCGARISPLTLPGLVAKKDRQAAMQLHAAADRALRRGIVVPEQALFACRLLPYPEAFRALADAFMHTDARLTWGDLTIADLLANPTGATIELGRIVAALAGLSPAAELAACSDIELRSLALAMALRADDPEQ